VSSALCVRSSCLSERNIVAALALGSPTSRLLAQHVLPNTVAPLVVQGTFVCGSAILVEAILSVLGVGSPPETPTWGNIMAEGRALFRILPHNILFPGIFLALTVLAVNILGDGLRDILAPQPASSSEHSGRLRVVTKPGGRGTVCGVEEGP